jgi:hypothetical protein
LQAIVAYCREHRGEYEVVPNQYAMWLGISNVIEAELGSRKASAVPADAGWWFRLTNRSWQLNFPQLATSIAATIVVAVLLTLAAMRIANTGIRTGGVTISNDVSNVHDRYRQQEQLIEYWNKRVEQNKARWTQQMRDAFDRNMNIYDGTVNEAMQRLNQNPHDEVSEDVLNAALNDKIALLKEFGDL